MKRPPACATRLTVAATAVAVLAACGVEPQGAPEPVPVDRLPSTTASPVGSPAPERVRVWGIREQRLVPVFVEATGSDAAPRIRALLALSDSEQSATAVPRDTRLVSVSRQADAVEIVLDATFERTPERQVPLALAQLVFTVTEVPGLRLARVRTERTTVPLVDARGRVVRGPLERSHFEALSEHPAG